MQKNVRKTAKRAHHKRRTPKPPEKAKKPPKKTEVPKFRLKKTSGDQNAKEGGQKKEGKKNRSRSILPQETRRTKRIRKAHRKKSKTEAQKRIPKEKGGGI